MRRVAVDANLLLLLIVGQVDPTFVERHKRLQAFLLADFDLLVDELAKAEAIVTTPNVLTEVSNLLGDGVNEPLRSRLTLFLESWIPSLLEHYCESRVASKNRAFGRLGLADSAWLTLLDSNTELLTADGPLYREALAQGLNSRNWNHIREERGVL